jgi:hypothetical protein
MTSPETYLLHPCLWLYAAGWIFICILLVVGVWDVRTNGGTDLPRGVKLCQCPHCERKQGYDKGASWWVCDSCGRKFKTRR